MTEKKSVEKKESKARSNLLRQIPDIKPVQMITSKQVFNHYNDLYNNSDELFGFSLIIPLSNQCSSTRENLASQHLSQFTMPIYPEVSVVSTGYEYEVGKWSHSFYKNEEISQVVAKISRYDPPHENLDYYLVLQDMNNKFSIVHRTRGQRLNESYGHLNRNEIIDSKRIGSTVQQNEILYKSTSYDEYMNYRFGINANVLYLSCPPVIEDAVWVSDAFVNRLPYIKYHVIEISLNTNELFLNLYGNSNFPYAGFPNIGEVTKNNILCAKRRVSSKSILTSIRDDKLCNINFSEDMVYYKKGEVIGIEIFSNKTIDKFPNNIAYSQIRYYYEKQQSFYKELRDTLGTVINANRLNVSDELVYIYHRACDLTSNKPIINGNKKFEHITMLITLIETKQARYGSKITGRFGDKFIIGKIVPQKYMPKSEHGVYADLVMRAQGPFDRLNNGQWTELELSFIADNVIRDLKEHQISPELGLAKIITFLKDTNEEYGESLRLYLNQCSREIQNRIYYEFLNNGLKLRQPPFWNAVGLDKLRTIIQKYPYAKYRFTYKKAPTEEEQRLGIEHKEVTLIRPLVMGKRYIIILKHEPDTKYSVRSLGLQNSLGYPSKSLRYKKSNLLHSDTSIRIGVMELMGLAMMQDSESIALFLSAYGNSIANREAFITTILTHPNPFDIRFNPVETGSINRKMLNALFKVGGTRIED